LARSTRLTLLVLAGAAAVAGAWWWLSGTPDVRPIPSDRPPGGGALVSSVRAQPRSFNRYVARDSVTDTISYLTQAKLVRVDRRTQDLEPWLAESWTVSADGVTFTLRLRRGVQFSDGTPFTSADVLFAFRAVYEDPAAAALADSLKVGGQPLGVTAPDESTIVIRFPSAFGPGLRLLDNLPILPRHRLEAALAAGRFADAWGPSTPPSEIAGLGPFALERHDIGQRLVFKRNPYYWRKDAAGYALPYLDRLTLEIVPDQNAELLRLDAGQIDFTQSEIRPEDYANLKRAADAGRLVLHDLGVGVDADSLWFNLGPPKPGDSRLAWLRRAELRRAISCAVDRQAFADTVFLGAAVPVWGPVTAANQRWHVPDLPHCEGGADEARRLLAQLGFSDRDGNGTLESASGEPARLTLMTQKGNTALERGAAVIRDDCAKVGLQVDVAALEAGSLIDRLERGDYEAVYFRFLTTDLDPALNLDFWLSRGGAHVWFPAQPQPATPWEARIDTLMLEQVATLDQERRRAIFTEVQRIFAAELPIVHFAAPRVYVATSARVLNATPSVMRPMVLWNPDTLAVRPSNGAPAVR